MLDLRSLLLQTGLESNRILKDYTFLGLACFYNVFDLVLIDLVFNKVCVFLVLLGSIIGIIVFTIVSSPSLLLVCLQLNLLQQSGLILLLHV